MIGQPFGLFLGIITRGSVNFNNSPQPRIAFVLRKLTVSDNNIALIAGVLKCYVRQPTLSTANYLKTETYMLHVLTGSYGMGLHNESARLTFSIHPRFMTELCRVTIIVKEYS